MSNSPELNINLFGEDQIHPDKQLVIAMHGLGGSARYFNKVANNLPLDFQMVGFDAAGFGDSQKPRDYGYTIDDQVHTLAEAMIDTDGIVPEDTIILGHSLGTRHALGMYRAELFFKGIVAVNMPASANTKAAEKRLLDHSPFMYFGLKNRRLSAAICRATCQFSPVTELAAHHNLNMPREVASDASKHTAHSFNSSLKSIVDQPNPTWDVINNPTKKVRVLNSEEDKLSDSQLIRELGRAQEKVEVTIVPNTGHHIPLTHPRIVAAALVEAHLP